MVIVIFSASCVYTDILCIICSCSRKVQ